MQGVLRVLEVSGSSCPGGWHCTTGAGDDEQGGKAEENRTCSWPTPLVIQPRKSSLLCLHDGDVKGAPKL